MINWFLKLSEEIKKFVMDLKPIDSTVFVNDYKFHFGNNNVESVAKFIDSVNAKYKDFTIPQWAYILATVYHETNATFNPVKEAYWITNAEEWRRKNLRYYPYYGRGFVQLTWDYNYRKYGKLLGRDFVNFPDLVMDYDTSFFILTHGMKNGVFTGKKIGDYINDGMSDFVNARKVINGTDKAKQIAMYAVKFETLLKNSV